MANVHEDTTGAEHPGFLQKIKETLHMGYSTLKEAAPTTATTPATTPNTAVSSKSVADAPAAAPASQEEPVTTKPSSTVGQQPTDLNSLAGHEAEHHGGVPTFLAALPDEDIPAVVTKETATSDTPGGEFFDSEEVFSNAQQGAHHEGVPTFLVALPDQDLPDEGTKENLHHVTAEETTKASDKGLDSEEVFSNAQQGEHHGGVPTFLVALPDQEIPEEVNKVVVSDVAGEHTDDKSGETQQFDSEEVFSKAQQGEHHEGVPTFMVALPDQDLPDAETKEKLHHVST